LCRIAGILTSPGNLEESHQAVQQMCTIQQHGGPDDEGIWADAAAGLVLGHRRLSLLDLSAAGHQPMCRKNRYSISFNGEIYNFPVLKNELEQMGHRFQTQTDTEVILAAYDQWGVQSFKRLQGMFAFALWDQQEQELLLVRDASGIKPLYYHQCNGLLAFASEVKAFQFIPSAREQDNHWPVFMMAYGHLPEPVTTLKEVKPLPKGFFLSYRVKTGETSLQNFSFNSLYKKEENVTEVKERLASLLRLSVNRHLLADAPIGVFLSGGIDSGILFLLAAEQKKEGLNSLSLYFNEKAYSEKKYQDILLDKVNCKRNQFLLKEDLFLEQLPRILTDMDQPSCDGINTWFISRYAREQGLKAVLSGIGADELLGGYPSFRRLGIVAALQQTPGLSAGATFWKGRKLSRLAYLRLPGIKGIYLSLRGQYLPIDIARQLDATEKEVWQILEESPVLPAIQRFDSRNQACWMETHLYMQNQLLKDADVMSMAHGIEIRVPFLDAAFLQYCMNIHPRIKYSGRLPKSLLIQAFKNELPAAVWNRPKMGFSFPFTEWFKNSGYVTETIQQAGPLAQEKYNAFLQGSLHWSQLLTLMLVHNKTHEN